MRNANFGGLSEEMQNLIEAPNIDTSMRSWMSQGKEGGGRTCVPSGHLPDGAITFATKAECKQKNAGILAESERADKAIFQKDLIRYAALGAWAWYGFNEGGAPGLVLGPVVKADRGVKKVVGYGGLAGAVMMAMAAKDSGGMGGAIGGYFAAILATIGGAALWSAKKR